MSFNEILDIPLTEFSENLLLSFSLRMADNPLPKTLFLYAFAKLIQINYFLSKFNITF